MANWRIADSVTTSLSDFELSWLPSAAYKYVTPKIRTGSRLYGSVSLEAGPYVGAIPLLNGDTLYIVPRLGQSSFSRMLLVAEGLEGAIREEFDDLVQIGFNLDETLPWTDLLSRPFINQLRFIEKSSLLPTRVSVVRRRNFSKGIIAIVPTLRNINLQQDTPIQCGYRIKSYSSPENQFLARAADLLMRVAAIPVDDHDMIVAARWANMFSGKYMTTEEVRSVMIGLRSGKYDGPRAYYIPALLMARLILSSGGISFNSEKTVESAPILTNLPILFESFVRRSLSMSLIERGLITEKRTGSRSPELFLDGTAKLEPDIVISDSTGIRLICDVKYKMGDSPTNDDYYQMLTYLHVFQVKKGLLILPAESKSVHTVKRTLKSGGMIFELYLPMNDPTISEDLLRREVTEILYE